jgi:hypothetical protein
MEDSDLALQIIVSISLSMIGSIVIFVCLKDRCKGKVLIMKQSPSMEELTIIRDDDPSTNT